MSRNEIKDLRDLLIHEIQDLHHAESQLLKEIPKMVMGVTASELREALESHLRETELHTERLEEALRRLAPKKGVKCEAMHGLIQETESLRNESSPEVRDAAIICAANRIEHYEIAAYGCATAFAKRLGLTEVMDLLSRTLNEEKHADQTLTWLAEQEINAMAMAGAAAGRQGTERM